jgi:hypothetical protein
MYATVTVLCCSAVKRSETARERSRTLAGFLTDVQYVGTVRYCTGTASKSMLPANLITALSHVDRVDHLLNGRINAFGGQVRSG